MKKLRHIRAAFLKRIVAANAGAVDDNVTSCAANARAMSGDEWEQVTPWGLFPNEKGMQRVNRTVGQKLVDKFNSFIGQAKNAIFGAPIYRGHPDVDPEHYPDDRRYGKFLALEAREDGLYCKPAWNSLGEENKKEGYWLFPSAVWRFKRCPGGVIEPTELLSIGLTNRPVIPTVQAWARNAKAANAGTSAGAHKGWATRRANGTAGAKNPRAVKALATMQAKKAGRKATPDDKAKAGERLQKKASKRSSKAAKGAPATETRKTLPPPLPAKTEAKPPPLPAPKSASTSSGPGTHVHIHVASEAPAPAKKGLFSSILDAFARPHVHDGGAINSDYFDDFSGRRRRVATNVRKRKTAAADANA